MGVRRELPAVQDRWDEFMEHFERSNTKGAILTILQAINSLTPTKKEQP